MALRRSCPLNVARLREAFTYDPATGHLIRVKRGRGVRVGTPPGGIGADGLRRITFAGVRYMAARLVWAWHHGELPDGMLRHVNGDNADDRIENLELIRKPLAVSYVHNGNVVSEYGTLPPDVTSGVYEIRCIVNGRRYVGSAVNLAARWRLHFTQLESGRHHSRHLQRAWRKYGEMGFVFRVLEQCDRASLIEREQHHIDGLKPEFNSRPRAGSQLGFRMTEESRAKLSAAAKRTRNFTGKRHSLESRAKISANRKGKGCGPHGPERVRKATERMMAVRSCLTPELVKKGRALREAGCTIQQVADSVECSFAAAADFLRGRTFAWVE